jgi:prevent-host-death family protein
MNSPQIVQKTFGIKELQRQLTRLVKQVRDQHAEFIITVDGKPCAILKPISNQDIQNSRSQSMLAFLQATKPLSVQVAEKWASPLTAAEAVAEQRRY